MNKLSRILSACAILALVAFGAAQTHFDPARTKVAIIPCYNNSGETWDKLKLGMPKKADDYQTEEFRKRGFVLVPTSDITSAINALDIDIRDSEEWKKELFKKIGDKLGANLVAFAVIMHSDEKLEQRSLVKDRQGTAMVKYWLYDVATNKYVVPGQTITGESGGSFFAGLDKGSDRKIRATANAMRDLLKPFFADYSER